MPALRGITVAVGEWYASTLEICLVRNMRHMTECLVITTPDDEAVKTVASRVPGVRLYETNDFYEHGAKFNKGLCMERGFDILGRHGWIVIHDADVIFPEILPLGSLREGHLNGLRRRILNDPSAWHPGLDWTTCERWRDGGPVGFFQCFHADDPAIRDKRPWYDVSFGHAGGGDAAFMSHWPTSRHNVMPAECLHLGPTDVNWFGCSPEARDMMARFVSENGWRKAMAKHSPEAAARAAVVPERVEVPGYPKSFYELPFVKRAKEQRAAEKR